MDLQIKSRSGKVSDRQRTYITDKLTKIERHLGLISKATVELSEENQRSQGEVWRVQVTLVGDHGVMLRTEQTNGDLFTAVDSAQESLLRQVQRYKDKHWRRGRLRRQGGQYVTVDSIMNGAAVDATDLVDEDAPRIVRTKEFNVKPMFSDEAVEQMELLGHDFFVFRDAETSTINVLYRRKDGNYGLIVPDIPS